MGLLCGDVFRGTGAGGLLPVCRVCASALPRSCLPSVGVSGDRMKALYAEEADEVMSYLKTRKEETIWE